MPAILPPLALDRSSLLSRFFTPYQIHWIQVEDALHAAGKQAIILAEKSVRIGWTYADAFKNVRKRLRFKNRDYLFATKDYPSALEYMRLCKNFTQIFDLASCIISHGEEYLKVPRLDERGQPSGFTEEIKMGVIKYDNGSRILAFSAHPQAMAVYGGDVGLDEFAKHQNARLLWETAQGRIAWGGDLAVWSAHDGEDTLFNEFVMEARLNCLRRGHEADSLSASGGEGRGEVDSFSASSSASASFGAHDSARASDPSRSSSLSASGGEGGGEVASSSVISNSSLVLSPTTPSIHQSNNPPDSPPSSPWNLYYRVTLTDAIELGLLEVINRTQNKNFTAEQYTADCRARARQEEIFQQAYMCNPMGAAANHIVEWSAIERCRYDYEILRVHLEHAQIIEQFGEFSPYRESERERDIEDFIQKRFLRLFQGRKIGSRPTDSPKYSATLRGGFDVAASGQGNLAAIYIDEVRGDDLWLSGLFTCRTDDWHFLGTVLFKFLRHLKNFKMHGDASGLGRQICWDAASRFRSKFTAVNFGSRKHDIGFALMNQLSTAQKRFPKSEQDVAADFFALRKSFQGNRWVFSEFTNKLNPASHCDIAWAGGLASLAHAEGKCTVGAAVLYDNPSEQKLTPDQWLIWGNDSPLWRPMGR